MGTFFKPVTVLLLIFSTSCDIELNLPFEDDAQKIYIIKKGNHESNRIPRFFTSDVLSFQAKFNSTAIYNAQAEVNQWDINKLLGFSDCNSRHHLNSARFGWRWLNQQLEIHAYCYIKGDLVSSFITVVNIDDMNDYKIENLNNRYIFSVNDKFRVEVEKKGNCSGGTNYMLFPYFGGDETAPHDIQIEIHIDDL